MRVRIATFFGASLVLAGCGAAQKSATPSAPSTIDVRADQPARSEVAVNGDLEASAKTDADERRGSVPASGAVASTRPAQPDPTGAAAPITPAPNGSPAAAAADSNAGVAKAVVARERQLQLLEEQTSARDCAAACQALGAMDRTTGEYCAVAADSRGCDDAKNRVRNARKRVRAACGTCGPITLDEGAPVPAK